MIIQSGVRIPEGGRSQVKGVKGDGGNASKLRMFSSVGCAVRTLKILTGWDFGAHGAPYYVTYFP